MSARGRNPALDALRCIAIVAVLIAHLKPREIGDRAIVGDVDTLAQRGVDLFFVLSGYLIGGIAIREIIETGRLDVGRFWKRRWMRTLPAYYVTLGLFALKQLLPHRSAGLVAPWAFIPFLQVYVIGNLTDFAHSWSLCVEEHFYLALPLVLTALCALGLSRPRHVAIAIAAIAVGFAAFRLATVGEAAGGLDRITHFRTDALSIGVLLACAEAHLPGLAAQVRRRGAALGGAATVLLALAGVLDVARSVWWQTAIAVAFGAWTCLAAARVPWLERIGGVPPVAFIAKISYSLYLLHPLVIGTLDQLYFRKHPETLASYLAFVIGGAACSIVAATISYRVVEARFLRLRDRVAPA